MSPARRARAGESVPPGYQIQPHPGILQNTNPAAHSGTTHGLALATL